MALMNVAFYNAVDLLPLGVAATLLYLGPFSLAVLHTPRGPQLILPALALVGVALVTRPSGAVGIVGVLVGMASALALTGYTLASSRMGRSDGLDSLALAAAVSGLLLGPFAVPAVPNVSGGQWIVLTGAGVLGVSITFAADFTALRLAGTRVVSVLFALDPVMGALLGALLLQQSLSRPVATGILLIILSGAIVSASSRPSAM